MKNTILLTSSSLVLISVTLGIISILTKNHDYASIAGITVLGSMGLFVIGSVFPR